jgi:hypothetical protein
MDLKHGRLASNEDGLFTDVLKCLDLARAKVDPANYFVLPTTEGSVQRPRSQAAPKGS